MNEREREEAHRLRANFLLSVQALAGGAASSLALPSMVCGYAGGVGKGGARSEKDPDEIAAAEGAGGYGGRLRSATRHFLARALRTFAREVIQAFTKARWPRPRDGSAEREAKRPLPLPILRAVAGARGHQHAAVAVNTAPGNWRHCDEMGVLGHSRETL